MAGAAAVAVGTANFRNTLRHAGDHRRAGKVHGGKRYPGLKGDQGYRQLDFYRQEGEMFYALHGNDMEAAL
ncbi:hypothetical protein C808_03223 [Lachnospiraceae bacterium M18-1]|nr:hypothetical protein C808_03223 [Lachnospiraceae bacterium M18-1]